MSDEDRFEWHEGIIVVPEQMAIAVYTNPNNEVVIRQSGRYGPDEDQWVVVAPEHALRLAEAIIREAGPIARPDIDWQAVNAAYDEFEAKTKAAPGKRRTDGRAAVEAALRSQPEKSNRAIAAECGVSDKTVAAVRAEFRTDSAETPHLFPQAAE
ncbi:MAG: hypothetical protein GEU95_01660 [Rhizobiales bacterium]|nr:hypothetical protein [Hyphomicrobiales bacterium]